MDDEISMTLKEIQRHVAEADGKVPIAPLRIERREEHKRVVIVTGATELVW